VIAVIAVLMEILMTTLNKARESGRKIVCKSNLRQIGVARLLYAGDVWRAGYPRNPTGAFTNVPGHFNDHIGRYIFKRHGYRNNILLLDGHVENKKLPDFGWFKWNRDWPVQELDIPWVPQ